MGGNTEGLRSLVKYSKLPIGRVTYLPDADEALDYGGVVFEDDRPRTLAEAMAALEEGLAAWYEDQGMELE